MDFIKNKHLFLYMAMIVLIALVFFVPISQNAKAFNNSITINTKQDFLDFVSLANENDTTQTNVLLTVNIDFEGATIEFITDFRGVFDGGNKTLASFVVGNETITSAVGLFSINNGVIQNLHINNSIIVSDTISGGIVGENNGLIERCTFKGSHISANSYCGGIAGKNTGTIRDSSANLQIYSPQIAGGIVGENRGLIESCYSFGKINATLSVGGIAGVSSGEINNVYSRSLITLSAEEIDAKSGGIVGELIGNGIVSNSYCAENIIIYKNGFAVFTGAIVGLADFGTEIENCYFDNTLLVGENSNENKGGWIKDEEAIISSLTSGKPLSVRDMSGSENNIVFTDMSLWIFLSDNLGESTLYYPQLLSFYFHEKSEIVSQSILSVSKDCDTSTITLYDDYGQLISQYYVFSGEESLPLLNDKEGFIKKGWSATVDGSIIDAQAVIVQDTTLYAVYELEPLAYVFDDLTATYGEGIVYSVIASHSAHDTVIEYEWYKMDGDSAVLIENERNSFIILNDCEDSGFYAVKAIATNGRYSTYEYNEKLATIKPYKFDIQTPIFSKTYGENDDMLTQYYLVNIGEAEETIEVLFGRDIGEGTGSYDVLSVDSLNPNFEANLIGNTTNKFIINKADYTYSFSFIDQAFVYDGQNHMLEYEENLPEGLDVAISMVGDGKSAGEHYVVAVFNGDFDNYNEIDSIQTTMYIQKANYIMDNVKFHSIGVVYDGQKHNIYMTGILPTGVTASFSRVDIKNAGEYLINITFNGDFDNYNRIVERIETITVLSKGIQPIFELPDNMVADGNEKEITITADGIIDGEEVDFVLISNKRLIEPGNYSITASTDNPNYILYDENAIIKIYAPYLISGGTNEDITISNDEGISSDWDFSAEETVLNESAKKLLGVETLYEGFTLALLFNETETNWSGSMSIKIAIPDNIQNMQNIKLLFYDTEIEGWKAMECVVKNGYIYFDTDVLGLFVIAGDNLLVVTDLRYTNGVEYILWGTFAVIIVLIVILIVLIARNRKHYKESLQTQKSVTRAKEDIFVPLTEDEKLRLYEKMDSGKFVDWELNRDLKNYAVWADYKIKD